MGTLNPLEVFPLEVWKMIFEQLSGQQGSSTNLLNCSRVCTTFENILMPTQFQWLFETIFPLVFPYMKKKEILSCRMVCKEWCRVVDFFLENFETRRPFNKDTTNISSTFMDENDMLLEKNLYTTYFKSVEDLSEFMKRMKNSKNPFIGGSVWLSDQDSYDSESDQEMNNDELPGLDAAAQEDRQNLFWKNASEFLFMFGERVKYLTLRSNKFQPVNSKEFYEFLRQYLFCLPNIRGLSVRGDFEFFQQNYWNSNETRRRLIQMKEFLEKDSSSLPEISSLETIEIDSTHLPRRICEKLIAGINPSKLKSLKLYMKLLSEEGTMITLSKPLPSLTELHLDNIKSFEHLQHCLTNLVSEETPIGKLEVMFATNASRINFDLVCEAISKFGRTLQMLSVLGFKTKNKLTERPDSYLSMLNIPHVRSLELDSTMFGAGPEYLPISFAPSLEYLTIKILDLNENVVFSRFRAPGTEFYKRAFGGELCYSSIWSKIPKLKGIKVSIPNTNKTTFCTREMHERGVRSAPVSIDEMDAEATSESDEDEVYFQRGVMNLMRHLSNI